VVNSSKAHDHDHDEGAGTGFGFGVVRQPGARREAVKRYTALRMLDV
jgi:hypothetical protein